MLLSWISLASFYLLFTIAHGAALANIPSRHRVPDEHSSEALAHTPSAAPADDETMDIEHTRPHHDHSNDNSTALVNSSIMTDDRTSTRPMRSPGETRKPVKPAETSVPTGSSVSADSTKSPGFPESSTDMFGPPEPTNTQNPVEPTEDAGPTEPTREPGSTEAADTQSPAEPTDEPIPTEPISPEQTEDTDSTGSIFTLDPIFPESTDSTGPIFTLEPIFPESTEEPDPTEPIFTLDPIFPESTEEPDATEPIPTDEIFPESTDEPDATEPASTDDIFPESTEEPEEIVPEPTEEPTSTEPAENPECLPTDINGSFRDGSIAPWNIANQQVASSHTVMESPDGNGYSFALIPSQTQYSKVELELRLNCGFPPPVVTFDVQFSYLFTEASEGCSISAWVNRNSNDRLFTITDDGVPDGEWQRFRSGPVDVQLSYDPVFTIELQCYENTPREPAILITDISLF